MLTLDMAALTPVELHYHVNKLLSQYVECIDDDRLEEWPDFFVEDCLYQVVSRENADRGLPTAAMYCDSRGMLADRVVALRHANIYARHYYRHILSNVDVKGVQDGAIVVHSNYLVLQTLVEGDTKVFSAGKYLDRIVSTADGLRFARRVVVFDTYRIPNLLVTPL